MGGGVKRLALYLEKAALTLGAALFAGLAIVGLAVTAHLGRQSWSHEAIVFTQDGLIANLLLVLLMTAAVLLVLCGIARISGVKLGAGLLGAWCALALVLVIGANVVQMYDFAYVIEGAELFARGNYKPLEIDYFNVYSYQLGICLPMEVVKRVLPGLNLSLFMQALNVLLSAGIAGVLCALSHVLFGQKEAKAALILFVLFMPMALQCIFVYGTLPMLLMASLSVLCFALYLKKRKAGFGLAYALCMAAAYMLKPNAAVPLIALVICAVLDVMRSRDWKLLAYAALSVVLSVLLLRAVIMQYELRAGVALTGDVSMLARLVMGLQRGGAQAGWFNRYTERFFPFDVTAQQEFEIASQDLAVRLGEMKADPGMALAFFRDKLLSQWLEPSHGALWYGDLCAHRGALSEMTKAVFLDGGAIRAAIEGYMAVFQKMLYMLFAVGLVSMIREKETVGAAAALAICAIGGCLYHMIFEAKSQYLYMYVMLMMPAAARGLTKLAAYVRHKLV